MLLSPILRIILRYVAGFLVAKGLLDAQTGADLAADADLLHVMEIAAGFTIAAVTEGFYALAKRFGWST